MLTYQMSTILKMKQISLILRYKSVFIMYGHKEKPINYDF